MKMAKLTKTFNSLPLPGKGSKDDARYEMLASFIATEQMKIELDESAAEDLKCLLAGKWMKEDPETTDIYSIKLFGSPISTWDKKTVEEYKKTYKKSYYKYIQVGAVMAAAKRRYLIKKALPVMIIVACAIGIFVKMRKS